VTTLGQLYAATPTPIRQDFSINVELLADHCARMLESGADGIVLFGTTGEGTFFSVAEKRRAAEGLLRRGLRADTLLIATGACALRDAADILCASRDLGFAATLVLPPFFTKAVSDDGIEEWLEALIAEAPQAKFLLYHIPAVAGVGISAALTMRMFSRFPSNVVGVKDSTRDSSLATALLTNGAKGLFVSTEARLSEFLSAGGAGVISASLNISMPIAKAVIGGAQDSAPRRLAAVRHLIEQFPLIWATKTILAERYKEPAWRRLAPPHRQLPSHDETRLLTALRELEQI